MTTEFYDNYSNLSRPPERGDIVRLKSQQHGDIGLVMGTDGGTGIFLDRHLDDNEWHFAGELFFIGVVSDESLSELECE